MREMTTYRMTVNAAAVNSAATRINDLARVYRKLRSRRRTDEAPAYQEGQALIGTMWICFGVLGLVALVVLA